MPKIVVNLDSTELPHGRSDRFEIERDGRSIGRLFFETKGPSKLPMLTHFNSAAVTLVNYGMATGNPIHFKGTVSRRLLENLEEYQCAWTRWVKKYRKVEITADDETSEHLVPETEAAVCAFSGGVDATFAVWRHHFKKWGRFHKDVKTAVLVQGFDIDIGDNRGMELSLVGAERMLSGTGIEIFAVRTNMKGPWLLDWEMNFGAGVAAVLHLFSHAHSFGIIGGDEPYDQLVTPWGSNPITNHLLSSQRFMLMYDGGYSRSEKVAALAEWENARDNLRVCWQGEQMGENCGRCEKCLRTKLNFLAAGADIPKSFREGITVDDIRAITIRNDVVRMYYLDLLAMAQDRAVKEPWVAAVRDLLARA